MAISAAAVLAVALGGYYSFVQIEEHKRVAPDVAFSALPASTQFLVTQRLADGDMSREFADYAGALASYEQAYALHPRNPEVTSRLVDLLTALTSRVIEQGTGRDALLTNLENVMTTDGHLGSHAALKDLRQQLESAS